ncbi:DNA-deoxyinosine glycosylase [Clostridium beijerinckii]|uniref:DNA-deoxyinosine glycosylase n=1 Tax=Clostridium beijerinckii TaxID=1520 RepID=UPI0013613966|nr:DNA-deoxyinosine glycosylase [Clostridium beijerinckii]MZK50971.1 DNA-deoxyinosine glycosylase [Clostridium beijerinckii]MZK59173.1 DNA-deoxyinosine glycosylase [Clostridium beijerinckii]MZK69292.1 DNA-deoxyinosine glycosylase [Clostridium beijerinckii]MZK74665.1 DNA-deoxyinosine glycosylase [Clostridium beijerinckii]MZK84384.1 DNA-deoxyinosine glycosylase [Clostridium beijerinckii]
MSQVKQMLEPIFDEKSRILILGTFPSVQSREAQFYYANARNRFWKVIAGIFDYNEANTTFDKKDMLLNNGIALWDVIESCEITGSSDSSIKNVVPADLSIVLNNASIEKIYANGDKAFKLYMRYTYPIIKRDIIKLPSTSPANAKSTLDNLIDYWKCIKE